MLTIRVDEKRSIDDLKKISQGIILGILGGIGIVFFIFVFLLLECLVICRLFFLTNDVSKVTPTRMFQS
jgi:hypothetical protein